MGTSIKMHFLQILLLTAMVAIAMEKCVAKYLLVEIEDEIAERKDSMFNARATNDCSKWSECSESCGYGFMQRVCGGKRKGKVAKYGKTIVKIQITSTKVIVTVHLLSVNL